MQLAPCPRCGRHLSVAETECPWCAAATPGLTPKRPRRVKNLTRAAIVYFGAVLAAPGCDGHEEPDGEEIPEVVDQPYGAPPPPEDDAIELEEDSDEAPPERVETTEDGPVAPVAQPYGASPFDNGAIEGVIPVGQPYGGSAVPPPDESPR